MRECRAETSEPAEPWPSGAIGCSWGDSDGIEASIYAIKQSHRPLRLRPLTAPSCFFVDAAATRSICDLEVNARNNSLMLPSFLIQREEHTVSNCHGTSSSCFKSCTNIVFQASSLPRLGR